MMISAEMMTAILVYVSFAGSMLNTTWKSLPPETNAEVVYTRKKMNITRAHTTLIRGLSALKRFWRYWGMVMESPQTSVNLLRGLATNAQLRMVPTARPIAIQ